MATLRELTFDVLFRDRATKALRRVDKRTDRVNRSMKKLRDSTQKLDASQKRLKRTNQGLASTWKLLAGGAVGGLLINQLRKIGLEAVSLAIDFEQTEISFETLLGSAKKGRRVLQELEDFSLVTPFEPDPIIRAGKALLAAQRPVEGLTDDLRRIGDIAAISGIPIQDLTRIFSKVFSKGKAQTEELLMVAERGIPILKVLADVMGVETTEEILEMGEKGEITFDRFNEAFTLMTSKGGAFEDGMKRLSLTTGGLISTFVGFRDIVKRTIGKETLEPLSELVIMMTDMAKETLEWLKVAENLQLVKDTISDIAEVLRLTLRVTAAVSRAMSQFALLRARLDVGPFGKLITRLPIPTVGKIVEQLAGVSRQFIPTPQPAVATPGPVPPGAGAGRTVRVDKVVENMTIQASTEEGGRAAARGFLDELDNNADKLEAQFQQ